MLRKIKVRLDSHGREILDKGLVTFFLKVLGAGLAFLFQFLIARYLGAAGSGLYFLALNVLLLLSAFSRLGMDNAVTRYVAAAAAEKDWAAVKGVTVHALRIALGVSLLFSALAYMLSEHVVQLLDKPGLLFPLRCMLILVAPLALMTLYAKAIQGLKMARETMLMQSVILPLVASPLCVVLVPSFSMAGAVTAYAAGIIAALVVGTYVWGKAVKPYRGISGAFEASVLVRSSIPLMWAVAFQQLSGSLPLLALGYWESSADVGVFAAAQRTASLVSLVLIAANVIMAPKMAELYQKGEIIALGRVARQGAGMMTVMASPVLLLCMLVPERIMSLFGPDFSAGRDLLVIMALGQIINVVTGSVGFFLIMTGNEKSLLSANFISLLLCAGLALVLIPVYGAVGAAIAVAAPLAIVNLIRVGFIWRKFKIMVLPLTWK